MKLIQPYQRVRQRDRPKIDPLEPRIVLSSPSTLDVPAIEELPVLITDVGGVTELPGSSNGMEEVTLFPGAETDPNQGGPVFNPTPPDSFDSTTPPIDPEGPGLTPPIDDTIPNPPEDLPIPLPPVSEDPGLIPDPADSPELGPPFPDPDPLDEFPAPPAPVDPGELDPPVPDPDLEVPTPPDQTPFPVPDPVDELPPPPDPLDPGELDPLDPDPEIEDPDEPTIPPFPIPDPDVEVPTPPDPTPFPVPDPADETPVPPDPVEPSDPGFPVPDPGAEVPTPPDPFPFPEPGPVDEVPEPPDPIDPGDFEPPNVDPDIEPPDSPEPPEFPVPDPDLEVPTPSDPIPFPTPEPGPGPVDEVPIPPEPSPFPVPDPSDGPSQPPGPIDPGDLEPPEDPTVPDLFPVADPELVTVSPADGATLTVDQRQTFRVTFDRPIDPAMLISSEFHLNRIGANGEVSVIFSPANPPSFRLSEDGAEILLAVREPLEPGAYQLRLDGNARIVFEDGTEILGDGNDQILSEFMIEAEEAEVDEETPDRPDTGPAVDPPPPDDRDEPEPTEPDHLFVGATLDDAENLGILESGDLIQVSGELRLGEDSTDVRLYRFELAEGHFWRLGSEIHAERIGSPIDTRLDLFDSSGNLIGSADLGRSDAPSDPFYYGGLQGGVYYLGIAGSSNDPSTNGYSPVDGFVGSAFGDQENGEFQLHLVADADVPPTEVIDFKLDYGDLRSTTPTGFTIQFSGPVNVERLGLPAGTDPLPEDLVVVDDSGQEWPVTALSFDESEAKLSFLFVGEPPVGSFDVRLGPEGTLLDLTGRAPIAADLEDGLLAQFSIEQVATVRSPEDIGAVLPEESLYGIEQTLDIEPGETKFVRFVVTFEASYKLSLGDFEGDLGIEVIGPDGVLDLGTDPRSLNGATVQLQPGIYEVRIDGSQLQEPTSATFGFRLIQVAFESLVRGGLGQGPALDLRLIAPITTSTVDSASGSGSEDLANENSAGTFGVAAIFPAQESNASESLTDSLGQVVSSDEPSTPTLAPRTESIGFPAIASFRVAAVNPGSGNTIGVTASTAEGAELLGLVVPVGSGQSLGSPQETPSRGLGDSPELPEETGPSEPSTDVTKDPEESQISEAEEFAGETSTADLMERVSVDQPDSPSTEVATTLQVEAIDYLLDSYDQGLVDITTTQPDEDDQETESRNSFQLGHGLGLGALAAAVTAQQWRKGRSKKGRRNLGASRKAPQST